MKKITAKIIRDWEYHHWERRLKSTRSEYLAFKINEFVNYRQLKQAACNSATYNVKRKKEEMGNSSVS
jgi:hypothetical protein